MRFSAPRSPSPSPVRGKPRHSSTFGLQSDSEDASSDYDDSCSESESEAESVASTSSSDSFCYASDSQVPALPPRPKHSARGAAEQRHIDETVAAIRLRTRHHDPYEEWEKQTRKDAFRTARKELTLTQSQLHDEQDKRHSEDVERLATMHAQQMAEVQRHLDSLKLRQKAEEARLVEGWKARDQQLWTRIEAVIKLEEDKVKARLEEERKAKEEEERKRKEEELRKRLLEEKREQEEEKKRKEEEEAQRQKEEEARREAEEERIKTERLDAEEERRKRIGLSTAEEDWRQARANLHRLKTESTRVVKANKELRTELGKWRRQITPKIGQLTNDREAINRISTQLLHILKPPSSPHPPVIYTALLSSLSKAILLQAETEVVAEKRSAQPLAQVAFNLLETLEGFSEVFFAKLVQRVGGWAIPTVIPSADYDGRPWADEAERVKAMGYRKSSTGDDTESAAEYTTRVAGVMRVYFHILKVPPRRQPLQPTFQLPRYWMWCARMLGERGLLETGVAAQLLYTALDVLGSKAKDVWGHQWIKMLALLYDGATNGFGGDRYIGGPSPEGKASRVRAQMEVERVMAGSG